MGPSPSSTSHISPGYKRRCACTRIIRQPERGIHMAGPRKLPKGFAATGLILGVFFLAAIRPDAAEVVGKVQGANSPIVGSTVTLYSASAGVPAQLAQGMTDDKGGFKLNVPRMPRNNVLYVVARGGAAKAP